METHNPKEDSFTNRFLKIFRRRQSSDRPSMQSTEEGQGSVPTETETDWVFVPPQGPQGGRQGGRQVFEDGRVRTYLVSFMANIQNDTEEQQELPLQLSQQSISLLILEEIFNDLMEEAAEEAAEEMLDEPTPTPTRRVRVPERPLLKPIRVAPPIPSSTDEDIVCQCQFGSDSNGDWRAVRTCTCGTVVNTADDQNDQDAEDERVPSTDDSDDEDILCYCQFEDNSDGVYGIVRPCTCRAVVNTADDQNAEDERVPSSDPIGVEEFVDELGVVPNPPVPLQSSVVLEPSYGQLTFH